KDQRKIDEERYEPGPHAHRHRTTARLLPDPTTSEEPVRYSEHNGDHRARRLRVVLVVGWRLAWVYHIGVDRDPCECRDHQRDVEADGCADNPAPRNASALRLAHCWLTMRCLLHISSLILFPADRYVDFGVIHLVVRVDTRSSIDLDRRQAAERIALQPA